MRRLVRAASVLLALALPMTACGGDNPFGIVVDEGGDFAITVAGDTQPTYDWEATNARLLVVFRASDSFQVWRIDAAAGSGGFSGPVTHGLVPADASEEVDGQALESGVQYRVEITLMDGRTSSETFVP